MVIQTVYQKFEYLKSFKKIAVAVSGGSDSMALLHLLKKWVDSCDHQGSSIPKIYVLTVDHDLRAESLQEALWVKDQAVSAGFEVEILKWLHNNPENKIQELAREARYRLMVEFCQTNDISLIALAHHQDDQVETILMRLARGSGIDGLAGMAEISPRDGIELYRPLLDVPKNDLVNFLEDNELTWKEDPSNENIAFERVKVRKLLNQLDNSGLSFVALTKTAKRLSRTRQALDRITKKFLPEVCYQAPSGYATLDVEVFVELPEEIALRVISHTIKYVRGSGVILSLAKVEELYKTLCQGNNIECTLSGCVFAKRQNEIIVAREVRSDHCARVMIAPDREYVWDQRFRVQTFSSLPVGCSLDFLSEQGFLKLNEITSFDNLGDQKLIVKQIRASLPAVKTDKSVLCVPHLGYVDPSFDRMLCDTEFINKKDI